MQYRKISCRKTLKFPLHRHNGAVGSFWLEALIRFHRSKTFKATRNYKIYIKSRLRLDLTLPGAFFAERNSFNAWLNFFRRVTARARCIDAVLVLVLMVATFNAKTNLNLMTATKSANKSQSVNDVFFI